MKKEWKFGTELDKRTQQELIRLAYEGKERFFSSFFLTHRTDGN